MLSLPRAHLLLGHLLADNLEKVPKRLTGDTVSARMELNHLDQLLMNFFQ